MERLSYDDQDFMDKIFSIIKEELPNAIRLNCHYLEFQNFKSIRNSVSKLKHKSTVFGFKKRGYVAQSQKKDLNNGGIYLPKELENIFILLEDFIKKL